MKCTVFACVLLCMAPVPVSAQETDSEMGDYSSMQIDAGVMKGTFDGAISELSDGVRIRLLSAREAVEPLPISARNMKFEWPENAARPEKIIMEGEVDIRHPKAHINSRRAEWDFTTGDLVFTGNPVINKGESNETSGEKMVINFKTNEFTAYGVKVREFNIRKSASADADPSLLSESDIRNWEGLINSIKNQAAGDAPAPGKQVIAQVDEELRGGLMNMPAATLADQKKLLLKQFNKVLAKPGLYREAAWEGIELDGETRDLLARESLSATEQTRLNRLLIAAAWPAHIAKPE
jgi:hypothetical protein